MSKAHDEAVERVLRYWKNRPEWFEKMTVSVDTAKGALQVTALVNSADGVEMSFHGAFKDREILAFNNAIAIAEAFANAIRTNYP